MEEMLSNLCKLMYLIAVSDIQGHSLRIRFLVRPLLGREGLAAIIHWERSCPFQRGQFSVMPFASLGCFHIGGGGCLRGFILEGLGMKSPMTLCIGAQAITFH